jgi:hypothetical protein
LLVDGMDAAPLREEADMTPRDQDDGLPEVLVVVASVEDAAALAPIAVLDPEVHMVLVATGPDPMAVDEALDGLGALAGRILLTDGPGPAGPVAETAMLMPRLDALIADDRPAVVVVRGGSATAMAAAQVAVWRGVPVAATAGDRSSDVATATQGAIAELAAWQDGQDAPTPAVLAVRRLVRERVGVAGARRIVGVPTDRPCSDLSA